VKTKRDPDPLDRLLTAVLTDEPWCEFKSQLHQQALATLSTTRRQRSTRLWIGRAAALLTLLAAAHWILTSSNPTLTHLPSAVSPTIVSVQSATANRAPYEISEQEMLALFPPGSCLVADIDGRKELVFLDPTVAAEGIVVAQTKR
jgi:hypothetical protein